MNETLGRDEDLRAAVIEAYTDEGQRMWWDAWHVADPAKRSRMETGVLVEWSGQR